MSKNLTSIDCRYTIESDGPDGRGVYPECFGPRGRRGRVLYGSASLTSVLLHLQRIAGPRSALDYASTAADATGQRYWVCDKSVVLGRDDFAVRQYCRTTGGSIDGRGVVLDDAGKIAG